MQMRSPPFGLLVTITGLTHFFGYVTRSSPWPIYNESTINILIPFVFCYVAKIEAYEHGAQD